MTEVSTESVRWLLLVTPELGGMNRSCTVGTTGSAVSPEESHLSEVIRALPWCRGRSLVGDLFRATEGRGAGAELRCG